jgi:hypothetical protein
MPIFIIDNGQFVGCHRIYFVEAPRDFGAWFDGVLIPWLRLEKMRGAEMEIKGICQSVSWRSTINTAMNYEEFLADDLRFEEWCYDRNPPEHRPRYRGA